MRVLVTGARGQVGYEVCALFADRERERRRGRAIEVLGASHDELDVADRDAVLSLTLSYEPDLVVHAAALTDVDRCETEPEEAYLVNALGARNVQEAARRCGAHLVYVSTDYVFDGESSRPYHEWDVPHPLSVYGASKLAGERELEKEATIVRTSWVCGREGQNMVKTVLRLLGEPGRELHFVNDQHGSPTIAADLARVLVELGVARRPGLFHVTNEGATTWYGFARFIATVAGEDPDRVHPISSLELDPPRPAPRPKNSVLDNAALRASSIPLLGPWEDSTSALVSLLTTRL